jgi:hypothetical protein
MHTQRLHVPMVILASAISALQSAALEPVRATCTISASEYHPGRLRLRIEDSTCGGPGHCDSNFDEPTTDRLTGVSQTDLQREGSQLTATLAAEAGTFTCAGTVHNEMLIGDSLFTPNAAFAAQMEQMGFSGLESEKLQTYALLDVESEWAHSLQQAGIQGLTTDNLIPLRMFKIDPDYAHGFTTLGYPLPTADQLIAMKVQGVNADEIREIRKLGYQPTFDELIQIRIFHVTPDFIRQMEARGLKNLTIAKLVQIKIFKLDE